jgi:hypothetical protein
MTQDDFQPYANQPPAQTEQLRRQMQTEQSSRQMPQTQASAANSAPQPEQRVAPGRRHSSAADELPLRE